MTPNYRDRIYPRYTSHYTPDAHDVSQRDLQKNSLVLLHRFKSWLPVDRNADCLDVACGGGQWLYALKQAGYKNVSGVDVSKEQVEVARRVCQNAIQSDVITYLQNNPKAFDLITGMDIVEHFRKDEVFIFLDALYAALRPGGRLILQTPNAETPWGLALRYGDFTHELAFTPESLSRVLRIAGFTDCESRECPPSVHGLKSAIRGLLWKCLRLGMAFWNLVETGGRGSGVYTRVFILKADKPMS